MIEFNLDSIIEVREIIRKIFPDNKVFIVADNDPECGELEFIIEIYMPDEEDVVEKSIAKLDIFDNEMYFSHRKLSEELSQICVTVRYV